MLYYRYCGFVIASSTKFPELIEIKSNKGEPLTLIEEGEVPPSNHKKLCFGPNWAVGPDESYWWLNGIVRFRITPGKIVYQAELNASESLIRALLLEAPMILALQYAGAFCLAVSAVSDGSKVDALKFLAGGGASTAAAWQVTRGKTRRLHSDTLLHVSLDDSGCPMAWPQGSGVLLWPKSIELLNLKQQAMRAIRPELPVKRVKISSETGPLPLKTIYRAGFHSRLEESSQEDHNFLQGRRPFRLAALQTAGRLWVDPIGKTADHFSWCLSIARHCRIEKGTEQNLYSGKKDLLSPLKN